MIETGLHALVALLVILDPPGTAAIFMAMTPGMAAAERRRQAIRAVVISFCVLLLFVLVGGPLLRAMGISIPAMQVAGGLLLFLMAADMVMGRHMLRTSPGEEEAATQQADISVFPLAIPLIAGPGSITSLVLLRQQAGDDMAEFAVLMAALLVALGAMLAALLGAAQVTRVLGATGTNVAGRVLGVLLAGLAAQFTMDGLRQAFG
ncbi:MAG: MarC family protein [Acetobacteraceae bacterium]|nr:MarC family protein [Acetobacteraceae bacterium]